MTSPDSVQFKVFLNRANQPEEIRRFTIEKDVVTNYVYLRQKLYSVFPILQSTGMTISWRDSDDDLVMIGSDEELIIALTEMEGICKKLYVKCVTPPQGTGAAGTRPDNHPKVIHDGVSCDGCESVVSGYRYKCMVCPDFDLCYDCEQKGFHPEHVMIRYPFQLAKFKDHHFVKKLKKLHKRFDHQNQMYCEQSMHGHDHRKSFKGSRGNRCPVMSQDVCALIDDFISTLRTQVIEVTPELIQEVIDGLSSLNVSDSNGPIPTSAPDTPSCCKKKGESSKKRDMEDRNNKKRGCPFSVPRYETSAESMAAAQPPFSNLISSVMQQVKDYAPHMVSTLNQMSAAMGTAPASTPGASAATPTTSTGDVPASTSTGDVPASTSTGPAPASTSAAQTALETNSAASSNSNSEPMVITVDDDSQPPTASPAPAQAASPNPSSSQQPANGPTPPSEHQQLIDRQLQSMLNMGFNNEGGYLRGLLEANGGDITKVLDDLGSNAFRGSSLSRLELD